jgi:hypothetical protein
MLTNALIKIGKENINWKTAKLIYILLQFDMKSLLVYLK